MNLSNPQWVIYKHTHTHTYLFSVCLDVCSCIHSHTHADKPMCTHTYRLVEGFRRQPPVKPVTELFPCCLSDLGIWEERRDFRCVEGGGGQHSGGVRCLHIALRVVCALNVETQASNYHVSRNQQLCLCSGLTDCRVIFCDQWDDSSASVLRLNYFSLVSEK